MKSLLNAFKKYHLKDYNFTLVIAVLLLSIIGVLAVGSALPSAQFKQILGIIIGFVVMVALSFVDFNWLLNFHWIIYIQAALSVTLTTQLLGMDTGGNISTEDVLHMCDESGIETGIDLAKLMELSRTLKDLLHHDTDSYVLRAGRSCDLLVGKD